MSGGNVVLRKAVSIRTGLGFKNRDPTVPICTSVRSGVLVNSATFNSSDSICAKVRPL